SRPVFARSGVSCRCCIENDRPYSSLSCSFIASSRPHSSRVSAKKVRLPAEPPAPAQADNSGCAAAIPTRPAPMTALRLSTPGGELAATRVSLASPYRLSASMAYCTPCNRRRGECNDHRVAVAGLQEGVSRPWTAPGLRLQRHSPSIAPSNPPVAHIARSDL